MASAAAPVDPVYAAIAEHKRALAAFNDVIAKLDDGQLGQRHVPGRRREAAESAKA